MAALSFENGEFVNEEIDDYLSYFKTSEPNRERRRYIFLKEKK